MRREPMAAAARVRRCRSQGGVCRLCVHCVGAARRKPSTCGSTQHGQQVGAPEAASGAPACQPLSPISLFRAERHPWLSPKVVGDRAVALREAEGKGGRVGAVGIDHVAAGTRMGVSCAPPPRRPAACCAPPSLYSQHVADDGGEDLRLRPQRPLPPLGGKLRPQEPRGGDLFF